MHVDFLKKKCLSDSVTNQDVPGLRYRSCIWVWWPMPVFSVFVMCWQMNLCKYKGSLFYVMSFRKVKTNENSNLNSP